MKMYEEFLEGQVRRKEDGETYLILCNAGLVEGKIDLDQKCLVFDYIEKESTDYEGSWDVMIMHSDNPENRGKIIRRYGYQMMFDEITAETDEFKL